MRSLLLWPWVCDQGGSPCRSTPALEGSPRWLDHQQRQYQGGATVSALQVACILYVGVQLLLPGQDAGMVFAREYALAKGMAGAEGRGED